MWVSTTPPAQPPRPRSARGVDGRFLPRVSSRGLQTTTDLPTGHGPAPDNPAPPTEDRADSPPPGDGPPRTAEPLPEDRFLNRELSWLDFNARVLALAEDPDTPLLERAKFLAIFASNLDEFVMVRVAGLKRRLQAGLPQRGGDQMPLRTQLDLVAEKTADLVARHAA